MTSVKKSPNNSIRVKKATSNRFMLLVVKILLVLVILLLLPKLVDGRTRHNIKNKKRRRAEVVLAEVRRECEMAACSRFLPEETMNCVQLCISPNCYQQVYGDSPLEDGEVDVDRALDYELCVRGEMKEARKRQRQYPELYRA